MSKNKWLVVPLLLLAGCGAKVEDGTAVAEAEKAAAELDAAAEMATEAITDSTAADSAVANANVESENAEVASADATPGEPPMEFLALPDDADPRMKKAYDQMIEQAGKGEPMVLLNLGMISSQIAPELEGKSAEDALAFHEQAARLLRKGAASYPGELPGQLVGPIYFNEARVLAAKNDLVAATKSLEEAVTSGFSDFDLLRGDDLLASVRSQPDFDSKLEAWEAAAKEKILAHAKEELEAGETFPFDFELEDITGTTQALSAYKGKVVIVDVWGTWCPPCREEIPSFIKLQEKLGNEQFQMIGLNYERKKTDEENLKAVVDYVAENGINYPCVMGDDATKDMIPEFRGFPTTLFIDKAGNVRLKAVGLHEYSYLEAVVGLLLAEETPE